ELLGFDQPRHRRDLDAAKDLRRYLRLRFLARRSRQEAQRGRPSALYAPSSVGAASADALPAPSARIASSAAGSASKSWSRARIGAMVSTRRSAKAGLNWPK